MGVQIEDDFLEEAVVRTRSLGFSPEPGSQGQVGEGRGGGRSSMPFEG